MTDFTVSSQTTNSGASMRRILSTRSYRPSSSGWHSSVQPRLNRQPSPGSCQLDRAYRRRSVTPTGREVPFRLTRKTCDMQALVQVIVGETFAGGLFEN